jgi:hypothetical protein
MAVSTMVHLALFKEDQLDEASEAIQKLRELGLTDEDISVISGTPFSEKMLGRPMSWTRVPIIAISGAVVGFLTALFLNWGTPLLYPIRVGGMPYQTIPTSFVVFFELTMLGLLISTFLGVFVEMIAPSYGPQGYDARVSDGQIGVLFTSKPELDAQLHAALSSLGAEIIHGAEAKKLWLF